eukprot:g10935.t1
MSGEEDNYAYDDGSGDEAAGCRRHELELDIHDAGSAGARKADHEDEKIKLSKRKRKKLEQIRKKKELQERQSAILDELQKHRLTAEESRRMGSTAVNLSAAGKRREAALAAKRQRELDKDEEIRGAKKAKLMQEQLEKQKQEAETEAAAVALAATARSANQGERNEKATELAPLGASGIGPCGRGRKVKKKQVVEAKAASIQAERDAGVSFGAKPGQRGFLDVEVPKMSAEMDEDADLENDDLAAADEDEESEARSAAAGGAGEGAASSTFMSLDSLVAEGSNKAGKPSSESLLPRDDDADAQAAPEADTVTDTIGQKTSNALFKIHKPEPLPQSSKTVDVTPRGTISSYKVERRPEIQVQRNKLPAIQMEQEVVEAVLEHDVVLIAGDTGCGKSTQIPQFLYENGLSEYGTIAVTQPRRVAAISVAQRVADELNSEEVVGYQVRYDKSHNCSSGKTKVKFLTDGIVLREVQRDFLLSQYSVVVLDEAHERSVNCDILIGMLSRVVAERRKRFEQERQVRSRCTATELDVDDFRSYKTLPLKLVIMSATLRVCDFTENERLFSSPPPVVRIDAKTFPVTIHFDRFTSQDYIKDAAKRSLEIHEKLPPGTILVFATGRMEVHRIVNQIKLLQRLEGKRKTAASRGDDDDAEALDETEGGCDNSEAEEDFDDDITGADRVKEDHRANHQDSATSTVPGAADVEVEKPRPLKPSTRKQAVRALKNQLKKAAQNSQGEVKKWAPKNADVLPAPNAAASIPDNRDTKSADAPAAKVEDEDEELLPADVFALDEHEDCAELKHGESPGEQEQADEDEYKKEKRIQMSKLDRSRTARGLFCGSDKYCETLTVLPLYAQLPARDQLKVFRKPAENERIVIVSTNVAETSVTLPNVRYVVDCGYEKKRNFTPSGISSFSVQFVSKASADQRAGRSGRVGPGHCYRLYSSAAYGDHFQQFPPINILNQPMDSVLLSMAAMGIPQLDRFPWPTPPPERNVRSARERLLGLGAFDVHDNSKDKGAVGDVGNYAADHLHQSTTATSASQVGITTMGRRLALLPMPPRYSVMLYQALQQALSWVKASREQCDQQKQKQDLVKNAAQLLECACLVAAALSTGNVLSWNAVGSAGVIGAGADGAKDDERKGKNNQNASDADGDDATGDEIVNEEEEDTNFSTSRKKQQAADARDAAILAEQEQYGVKRGGKDAKRATKQPDWLQCDDDMEALLWAMQNYAAMSGSDQLQREDFCKDNWIHPKNIEESNNLANQLQMILKTKLALPKALLKAGLDHTRSGRKNRDASSFKTANRNGQASFSQLDPQVSLSLRRCILCGLIDHVAKQSPERPKLYDAALPHSADKSYLKVQAGLHISSRLLHKRPALLAYVDLMSSVCARTGRKKHFLSGCVAVDPVDLGRLNVPVDFSNAHATPTLSPSAQRSSCSTSNAQTKFATPLLSYADILAIPTPKYDKTTHQITVHVAPRYLPLEIRLPTLPNVNLAHVENSVAHANKAGRGGHSDAATSGAAAGHGQQLQTTGQQVPDALSVRYRVFAKALLDGHIFPQTVKFCAGGGGPGSNLVTDRLLTSRPNELLSTCNSAVANLVFELQRLRCSDKKSFVEGGLRLRDALLGCFPKNVRVAVVKELVESGAYKS